AHRRLAREAGATLLEQTRVLEIDDHGNEILVDTGGGRIFSTGAVVVATDAWTNDLLGPLGEPLPLTVTREQVTWFEAADPAAFEPDRFPVWIWLDQPS